MNTNISLDVRFMKRICVSVCWTLHNSLQFSISNSGVFFWTGFLLSSEFGTYGKLSGFGCGPKNNWTSAEPWCGPHQTWERSAPGKTRDWFNLSGYFLFQVTWHQGLIMVVILWQHCFRNLLVWASQLQGFLMSKKKGLLVKIHV